MNTMLLGLLLVALGSVEAHPGTALPEVSIGENPRRSFGGSIAGSSSGPWPIVTVPSGQEFIVTMVATSSAGISPARDVIHGFEFLDDSGSVLSGYVLTTPRQASITRGDGRLRIAEGATLMAQLHGPGSGDYYLQGFFVAAGSPYRSFNGTMLGSSLAVMTSDPERDFVVRTVVTDCPATGGSANVLVDGSVVIPDSTDLTILGHTTSTNSPFVLGKGQLVVPAGKTLSIASTPKCDYYIDGEYVNP
jgi:hypothetical protein